MKNTNYSVNFNLIEFFYYLVKTNFKVINTMYKINS